MRTYIICNLLVMLILYYFETRFGGRKNILLPIVVGNVFAYLYVRIQCLPLRLDEPSFYIGICLFMLEAVSLGLYVRYLFRSRVPYKSMEHVRSRLRRPTLFPYVSIIIVSDESKELLEKTIIGCLNQTYPSERLRIYVREKKRRGTIERLCSTYGISYLTGDELSQEGEELYVLLHANMIPKRNFLLHTVGCFEDERVAYVQLPKVFYNGEENLFSQSSSQNQKRVTVIFKREALQQIGRFNLSCLVKASGTIRRLQRKDYIGELVEEDLLLVRKKTTISWWKSMYKAYVGGKLQVGITAFLVVVYSLFLVTKQRTGISVLVGDIGTMFALLLPLFLGELAMYRLSSMEKKVKLYQMEGNQNSRWPNPMRVWIYGEDKKIQGSLYFMREDLMYITIPEVTLEGREVHFELEGNKVEAIVFKREEDRIVLSVDYSKLKKEERVSLISLYIDHLTPCITN